MTEAQAHPPKKPVVASPLRCLAWAFLSLGCTGCLLGSWLANQIIAQEPAAIDREIELWIAKLGSESYSERTQAHRRLETFGVRAFNSIRQATRSQDPQIASQARFLLQSNHLQWLWNNEPFETRKLIQDYNVAQAAEKEKLIRDLNALGNNHGVAALCRISCFETDEVVSKLAALELLQRLDPRRIPGVDSNPALRNAIDPKIVLALLDAPEEDLAALVLNATEGANSRAAGWLRLAFSKSEPWPAEDWIKLLDQEQELLENSSPETRLNLFVALTTWVAQQAKSLPEGRSLAVQIAKRIPPLLLSSEPDPDKLVSFAEWAIQSDLPELVQDQYRQLPKQFPETVPPILHYLLAEIFAQQGKQEVADLIAKNALERKPILLNPDLSLEPFDANRPAAPQNPLLFRSVNFNSERAFLAQMLIKRGSYAWAQAELSKILEGQQDSPDNLTILSLYSLSQMLHEQDLDQDAANVLEKWVNRYENEKLFRMQVEEYNFDIPSNYYLYRGNQHVKEGNAEKAREAYFQSIDLAEESVDALIGLARLNETPEQKRRRQTAQDKTVGSLRNQIEDMDRALRLANPMFQTIEKRRLANSLNTLAWLMINTDSDPQEALLLSRRSCSLVPDQSAYQDTLAHCLEKNQKYREAFRTQIKALTLEPHQLSLQRALVRFYEKAAKELPANP